MPSEEQLLEILEILEEKLQELKFQTIKALAEQDIANFNRLSTAFIEKIEEIIIIREILIYLRSVKVGI